MPPSVCIMKYLFYSRTKCNRHKNYIIDNKDNDKNRIALPYLNKTNLLKHRNNNIIEYRTLKIKQLFEKNFIINKY